jgi:hypothetical protein
MIEFYVRDEKTGDPFGPYSAEQILSLISNDAVHAWTLLSLDGKVWRPCAEWERFSNEFPGDLLDHGGDAPSDGTGPWPPVPEDSQAPDAGGQVYAAPAQYRATADFSNAAYYGQPSFQGMAIGGFVCSIVGVFFCGLVSVAGCTLCGVALANMAAYDSPDGKGLAIAGVVIGMIGTAITGVQLGLFCLPLMVP